MSLKRIEIRPQPGPQEAFLASCADIVIFGGAAGGGKSYGLLLDQLRHINNPSFKSVIFRRENPMITNPGGLWDEAKALYQAYFNAIPVEGRQYWRFPSGMIVKMSHMFKENDKLNWQGAQLDYIGFDEVTHFTQTQFFYMLSRARSMSGAVPRIRATCNPDADSWVANLIAWWINQKTGLAIPERSGVIRWFIREGDTIVWGDSAQELLDQQSDKPVEERQIPLSLTFIPSKLSDNKKMMEKDPGYKSRLMAMNRVDRARLLDGNWKIKATAGILFRKSDFEIVEDAPTHWVKRVRFWDRASTGSDDPSSKQNKGDATAGCLMSMSENGLFHVEHMEHGRWRPHRVKQTIFNTAGRDGKRTSVGIFQDPGQAGVFEKDEYFKLLRAFHVVCYRETKDKVAKAKPVASQAGQGNIKVVKGPWTEGFLNELENFPDGDHDDRVDSLSGAYMALVDPENQSTPRVTSL